MCVCVRLCVCAMLCVAMWDAMGVCGSASDFGCGCARGFLIVKNIVYIYENDSGIRFRELLISTIVDKL